MTHTVMTHILDAITHNAFRQGATEHARKVEALIAPLREKDQVLYFALEDAANAYAHRFAEDAARLAWEVATDPAALAKLPSAP